MARFVIVGLYNCPHYARANALAQLVQSENPAVDFQCEMKDLLHWHEFVLKMKQTRDWEIKHSPVIWEILTNPDGKVRFIGDSDDFGDFAKFYFEAAIHPGLGKVEELIAINTAEFFKINSLNGQNFTLSIINGPPRILELFLTKLLTQESKLPPGIKFNVKIFDYKTPHRELDGMLMEFIDLASPLLGNICVVSSLPVLYNECDMLIILEDFSRLVDEKHNDWLARVNESIRPYANRLDQSKNVEDCRVIIGGNGPNCYIAEIFREQTSYSTVGQGKLVTAGQHVVQRAKCEIGKSEGIPPGTIDEVMAWGWPGMIGTFVDVSNSIVREDLKKGVSLLQVAKNSEYLNKEFSGDFLHLQRQRMEGSLPVPISDMCVAESVLVTVQTWLQSERLTPNTLDDKVTPNVDSRCESFEDSHNDAFSVLLMGIESPDVFEFPLGTFMVQPVKCISGVWQPIEDSEFMKNDSIRSEVKKLWKIRNALFPGFYADNEEALHDTSEPEADLLNLRNDMEADLNEGQPKYEFNSEQREEGEEEDTWNLAASDNDEFDHADISELESATGESEAEIEIETETETEAVVIKTEEHRNDDANNGNQSPEQLIQITPESQIEETEEEGTDNSDNSSLL